MEHIKSTYAQFAVGIMMALRVIESESDL